MAERGGFEPPNPFKGVAAFRVRCIQPLCHLSTGKPVHYKKKAV